MSQRAETSRTREISPSTRKAISSRENPPPREEPLDCLDLNCLDPLLESLFESLLKPLLESLLKPLLESLLKSLLESLLERLVQPRIDDVFRHF